jgi:hypothetical protein
MSSAINISPRNKEGVFTLGTMVEGTTATIWSSPTTTWSSSTQIWGGIVPPLGAKRPNFISIQTR